MTPPQTEVLEHRFQPSRFLPERLFESITELRVSDPDKILVEAERRLRRPHLTLDGRLVIVATDHAGRRVTAAPGDPLGMGDRHAYLARALRALTAPGVDGVMGTTDFMEDLLLLSYLVRESGKPSFLDEKVLVGCMNRGGHAGVEGEIDDRFTCFTASRLRQLRFEGGKMMYRLDPRDPLSIKAISDCAQAVTDLYREGLYSFLEPMTVRRKSEGGYETVTTVEALVKDAGAASALGESSARTFLKLSYTEGYARVARATTLPILMLGGPTRETPLSTLQDFHAGMRAGSNVRGALVGRNVTFAVNEDPRGVAAAVAGIVHDRCSVERAQEIIEEQREQDMDELA